MSYHKNIFVAGFGRCGTTAMMQVLWQGGAPVAGPAPVFEDSRLSPQNLDLQWVEAQRGKILKWVDPINNRLPPRFGGKTILMERDLKQQVHSQIKMLKFLNQVEMPDTRRDRRRWAFSLRRETPIMVARLRHRGPVLRVQFEDLLSHPLETALLVQEFLGPEVFPNPQTGAKAVLKRGPKCTPDMSIEENTLIAWKRSGGK